MLYLLIIEIEGRNISFKLLRLSRFIFFKLLVCTLTAVSCFFQNEIIRICGHLLDIWSSCSCSRL